MRLMPQSVNEFPSITPYFDYEALVRRYACIGTTFDGSAKCQIIYLLSLLALGAELQEWRYLVENDTKTQALLFFGACCDIFTAPHFLEVLKYSDFNRLDEAILEMLMIVEGQIAAVQTYFAEHCKGKFNTID